VQAGDGGSVALKEGVYIVWEFICVYNESGIHGIQEKERDL
jgi:hypothetical protein